MIKDRKNNPVKVQRAKKVIGTNKMEQQQNSWGGFHLDVIIGLDFSVNMFSKMALNLAAKQKQASIIEKTFNNA